MMKRIGCVYLGDWPIQRLVAKQPELRRQRIVLYAQDARGRRVSAISPAARRDRVRIGMPLSEAQAILKEIRPAKSAGSGDPRTAHSTAKILAQPVAPSVKILTPPAAPTAHFFPHDRDADRAELVELGLSCESLAPRVGLEPGPHPECLFLDVTGVAHLFGGEPGLLQQIQRHFAQRGYSACAVLADSIGAAWGLARFGGETDFARLPIEALRLTPATCQTLRQLGVERIEQVHRLPRADLWARFGGEIHQRLDQASGVQEEVLDWLAPPVEFYAQRFLDFPTTDATTIHFLASQLVEQLCRELRARQRGGLQWECRLNSPEEAPLRIEVNLFQPAAAVEQIIPLLQMQFEQQNVLAPRRAAARQRQDFTAPFSVHHLSVSVRHSDLLIDRQRLLFDENPRLDKESLAQLINRLSARLGAERVLGMRLLAEAQPELACRFEPLVGSRPRRPGTVTAHHGGSPLQRPLQLHPPIAVQVLIADESRPAYVVLGDQRRQVARSWGPERIETGWWRGPTVRRDYWRVELDDGRWLWLFCDLGTHEWFCQGEF